MVGFTTVNVPQGEWKIVGAQFEATSGAALDINEFISGDFKAGDDVSVAPMIQFWDGSTLVPYYYCDENVHMEDGLLAWTDDTGMITEVEVKAGQAVWFLDNNEDCTVQVAGQVGKTGAEVTANAGEWNLIASPYPEALFLNSEKVDWGDLKAGDDVSVAPCLQVWDGSTLIPFYYCDENVHMEDGLLAWTDDTGMMLEAGSNDIAAGEGFWLLFDGDDDVTITFAR